ncbi:MAG: addiction module protein [Gemmatales bacterium]
MTAQLKTLGVDRLSIAEQMQLFQDLWDHLAEEIEKAPFTPEQCNEIDKRLARHQAHPDEAIPWEQVEAEALAKLRS